MFLLMFDFKLFWVLLFMASRGVEAFELGLKKILGSTSSEVSEILGFRGFVCFVLFVL